MYLHEVIQLHLLAELLYSYHTYVLIWTHLSLHGNVGLNFLMDVNLTISPYICGL